VGVARNGARARELGLARSIGVSNFSAGELDEVMAAGTIPPAVNQAQFSALEYRRGLLDAGQRRGIVLEAYSPLGTGQHLANKTVNQVAQQLRRTPAQVLLRWCLQHDVPVIAKSTHRERIQETRRSSTSPSPARTWPSSMCSTRPTAPAEPWKTRGGENPFRCWGWVGQPPAWTGQPYLP
jgi:diketogulonate reductase-like aldo/keto reductase